MKAFLLTSTAVADNVQIHTHMCYSDFNDIFEAIKRKDADVVSIESSRSSLELLTIFKEFDYTNEIGQGLYNIQYDVVLKLIT